MTKRQVIRHISPLHHYPMSIFRPLAITRIVSRLHTYQTTLKYTTTTIRMSDNTQQPGLVGSHAAYVKGQAVETIGNVTGSEEWKSSGSEQKDQAVKDMKSASENREPQTDGYGKVEELAGKATGCEGMEKEGAQSKTQ